MSSKSCPISLISVDSNIARINAFYTGVLVLVFLSTMQLGFIYFLILDFATRLFLKKEYSVLYILSSATKDILKLESVKVDAAPKRLANYFGLFFLLAIALVTLAHFYIFSYIFSTILLICILLEVLFSYCLGCEIYYLYQKFLA